MRISDWSSDVCSSDLEFFGNQLGCIGVDQIARLHHLAFLHQEFDDIDRTLGHTLSEFLDGDGFRQNDFTSDLLAALLLHAALEFLLAATHGALKGGG